MDRILAALPLPSLNGCICTSQNCAIADFTTGCSSSFLDSHSEKSFISAGTLSGGGGVYTISPVAELTT